MTTIAWDGKTLAVDKQVSWGGQKFSTVKLGCVNHPDHGEWVFAICGDISRTDEFIRTGLIRGNMSVVAVSPEGEAFIKTGQCKKWGSFPVGWADGSGAEYAIGAMGMGATAEEAIAIASLFDMSTGLGVDSYTVPVVKKNKK